MGKCVGFALAATGVFGRRRGRRLGDIRGIGYRNLIGCYRVGLAGTLYQQYHQAKQEDFVHSE